MSMATASRKTKAPDPQIVPPVLVERIYRFSTEQYDRMAEMGILPGNAELIEGWIVQKMTQHPPHIRALTRLTKRLVALLHESWDVRIQGPIALGASRPEPDCAVVRGPDTRFADRHPGGTEIALLIEIGDSTLLEDRRFKLPIYAAARVVEVWLINLVQGQVEIYTQPRGGRSPAYRQRRDYQPGEEVPLVLEGKEIARLSVSYLCLLED
jgi:hypothetical protein